MYKKTKSNYCIGFFLLISIIGFSQNINLNSNTVIKDSISPKKISILNNNYVFLNNVISEENLHLVLMERNNNQIIELVKESKSQKTAQHIIGCFSIPFAGAAAFLFYKSYQERQLVYVNGQFYKDINSNYFFLGTLCLTATIVCPFSAAHYKKQRKKYNRLAIERFNQ